MTRVFLFVLIAVTSWCKSPEKLNTGDSTSLGSSFRNINEDIQRLQKLKPNPRTPIIKDNYFQVSSWETIDQYKVTSTVPKAKRPPQKYGFAGITTGVWRPIGLNKLLGTHPSVGIALGIWSGRWLVEGDIDLRFIQSATEYQVTHLDSVETTHHYLGYFVGAHVGYGIINLKSTSIYLLCGLGLDGFDAINDDSHDYVVSIMSFNANAGVGFQHFGKKGGYWGIELQYNGINYCNPGGTPLDGNGLSLRLSFGGIDEQ